MANSNSSKSLNHDIFEPTDEKYDLDVDTRDYLDDPDYLEEFYLMSGNPEINEFIRKDDRLKWIPYGQLTNIEYLASKWKSQDVVLKSLNNSKDLTVNILREIAYHQLFDHEHAVIYVVQCYGISRDRTTGNCLMVMHYLEGDICNGLRSNLDVVSVPKLLKTLIIKCWDDNPTLCPTAQELLLHFDKWYFDSDPEFRQQYQQINVAEESLTSNNLTYQTHPQAIYTSRLLYLNSRETDLHISEELDI
ncbi:14592_t:CDS:2 [Dentiscutata erythropus]|uniref:14592_t:CDS:1 n=1 Tax=Dentiscutata erythropus TaxID=1348616 RepID=A0A9N9JF02_9GLOM|nr:14592_t:CDS:2 [Dentiscutata erythropus]